MKIIFATSTINEDGGGISSYAIDFIKEFHSEHEFLVISNDKLDSKYVQLIPKYVCLPSRNLSYKNSLRFLEIVKEFNPDVIINSNFTLLSVIVSFVDNKIIKISISHFVDGLLAIKAGFNHQYYDIIIALSNEGGKSLRRYYPKINMSKVKTVYNFFRPNCQIKNRKDWKNKLSIVFPGGASLHKNPLLVYKILHGLIKTDLQFNFYWLGSTLLPGSRFFGRKYISSLFLPDKRIIFTETINRDIAIEIIQSANIFLLPSSKEGCAITLLEAMSVGTIPIVSDAKHASSEIIIHGVNGFVLSSTNANEYLQLILTISNNPSKYKDIEENCLITFNKFLTAESWKENMKMILRAEPVASPKLEVSLWILKVSAVELFSRLLITKVKLLYRSLYFFLLFHFYAIKDRFDLHKEFSVLILLISKIIKKLKSTYN